MTRIPADGSYQFVVCRINYKYADFPSGSQNAAHVD